MFLKQRTTTLLLLCNLCLGKITQSITIHQAGEACQVQVHQLIGPIHKLLIKRRVVNMALGTLDSLICFLDFKRLLNFLLPLGKFKIPSHLVHVCVCVCVCLCVCVCERERGIATCRCTHESLALTTYAQPQKYEGLNNVYNKIEIFICICH